MNDPGCSDGSDDDETNLPPSDTTPPTATMTSIATPRSTILTSDGQPAGTIAGTAADNVGVTNVDIVIRSGSPALPDCDPARQEWNGSGWSAPCTLGALAATVSPAGGTSVTWSFAGTPPASQMTYGQTYRVYYLARDASGNLGGWLAQDVYYASPLPTTANYTFWWNCDSPAVTVSQAGIDCGGVPPPGAPGVCGSPTTLGVKCDAMPAPPFSQSPPSHAYGAVGTYRPKVVVERGTDSAEARTTVTVTDVIANCGNGIRESYEQCDLGSGNGFCPSSCDSFCTWNNCPIPVCGDGFREGSEQCDNGWNNGPCPQGCSTSCTINSSCPPSYSCGNGYWEPPEQCDNGAWNGACPAYCSTSCTINGSCPPSPVCGDGFREGAEQCDNGWSNGPCPQSCSTSCTINSSCPPSFSCGNGYWEPGEQCDNGPWNGACPAYCSTSCTVNGSCPSPPVCGNGVFEAGEQCDNGWSNGSCPSTCSFSCTTNSCSPSPSVCGNGIREGIEQCDNGWSNGPCPQGCSISCTVNGSCPPSTVCGNGIWEAGEQCDHGYLNGPCPERCSSSCTTNTCGAAVCGNGYWEFGEQCDFGANNGACPAQCSASCTWNSSCPTPPVCGNGFRETGEQCDNGWNNGPCPASCSGLCATQSCAVPPCGNGIVEWPEQCDQGSFNGACPAPCSGSCTMNTCGGAGLPVGTITPIPNPTGNILTSAGQPFGTIAGSASDDVSVQNLAVVIRKNVLYACDSTPATDWNGSGWSTACGAAGLLAPFFSPGPFVNWTMNQAPPANQMTPGGSYIVYLRTQDNALNYSVPTWISLPPVLYSPQLSVLLSANPQTGPASLWTNISMTVQSNIQGATNNYNLWWNCSSASTDLGTLASTCGSLPAGIPWGCATNANGAKCDGSMSDFQSLNHIYAAPGTFYPKVVVERGSIRATNAPFSVVVSATPVNLTVTSFAMPNGPPNATVSANVTIQNTGALPTPTGFEVAVNRNSASMDCSSPEDGFVSTAALGAGASRSLTIPLTLPGTVGPYTAVVMVDSDCAVVEGDESGVDNTWTDAYAVTALAPVCGFAASKTQIVLPPSGQTSELTWNCGSTVQSGSCSVITTPPGSSASYGGTSGSQTVTPAASTQYVLTCRDLAGAPHTESASVQVFSFSGGSYKEIKP